LVKPSQPLRWGYRLLILSGLLALAGCASDVAGLLDDPIRGGPRIPLNATTTEGARGAASAETPAPGGLPALPPAQAPSSNAALAVGASGVAPDRLPTTEVGVKLSGPRPVIENGERKPEPSQSRLAPIAATGGAITPVSAVVAAPAVPAPGAYEQLQQMLVARGVTSQRLETGSNPDEWHFVCTIPLPGLDNLERTYEARAVGASGLAAIRAVIADIDKDRGGQ
jgi:hypothetical protein